MKRKVSELTIDELKSVIREAIAEEIDSWQETLEIIADRKLMRQIRKADADWKSRNKKAYTAWQKS